MKKIPTLKQVYKDFGIEHDVKQKRMTDEQMFNMVQALNAALGGDDLRGKEE